MYGYYQKDRWAGVLGVAEVNSVDQKRINEQRDRWVDKQLDKLHKQLERSSPSTSRVINGKDKSAHSSVLTAKIPADSRSASLSKTNASDGAEESETANEVSDVSGSDGGDMPWVNWFCNLRGNEFFCEVDVDYIDDDFNLTGLSSQVPDYEYALEVIQDNDSFHSEELITEEENEQVQNSAELLYGLIHARYILTSKGMDAMLNKFKNGHFGRCPRIYCVGQPCLPVSQSDIPRSSTVKIFCPRCEDIFYPRSKYHGNIDGAYFGTTFPHLFLMTYANIKPTKDAQQTYVPKVFGFKVHKP